MIAKQWRESTVQVSRSLNWCARERTTKHAVGSGANKKAMGKVGGATKKGLL